VSTSTNCKNIVLTALGRRPWLTPPRRRSRLGSGEPADPPALRRAELGSARFLSVRERPCRRPTALAIEDQFGDTGASRGARRARLGRRADAHRLGRNGVALFLGDRDTLDPANVSFYGADGCWIACHRALTDKL